MRRLIVSFLLAAPSMWPSAAFADSLPYGTFSCSVMMVSALTGTSSDQFVPSVIGTFSLNGLAGYTRNGQTGTAAAEGGVIRFTSGEMEGIVAVLRRDPRGRSYLHIDGQVTSPPAGNPKQADFVCYQQ